MAGALSNNALRLLVAVLVAGMVGCESRTVGYIRHEGTPWEPPVGSSLATVDGASFEKCFQREVIVRPEPSGDERSGFPALGRTFEATIRKRSDAPGNCPDLMRATTNFVQNSSYILLRKGESPAKGYRVLMTDVGGTIEATVVVAPYSSRQDEWVAKSQDGIAQVFPSAEDPQRMVAVAALDESGTLIDAWTVLASTHKGVGSNSAVARTVELFSYKKDFSSVDFSADPMAAQGLKLLSGRFSSGNVDLLSSTDSEVRLLLHCTSSDRLSGWQGGSYKVIFTGM